MKDHNLDVIWPEVENKSLFEVLGFFPIGRSILSRHGLIRTSHLLRKTEIPVIWDASSGRAVAYYYTEV